MPAAEQALALRQHQHRDKTVVGGAALDFLDREIRRLHRHHDRGAQPRILRQPFGRDPVVDRLAEVGRHIGIEHRLGAVQHIADGVAGAELVERAALHHGEIAAGLVAIGGPPVGAAGQRHVGRIGVEIEAVDGAADHLLFPVVAEIGQQRGAGSTDGGMDIAVDPRGGHARSLKVSFLAGASRRGANVQPAAPSARVEQGSRRMAGHG